MQVAMVWQIQGHGWYAKGLALPFLPGQLEPSPCDCLHIAGHANLFALGFEFFGLFEADELAALHLAGMRASAASDSFIINKVLSAVHDATQSAGSAECRLFFQRL
jgi:hypothetical protein